MSGAELDVEAPAPARCRNCDAELSSKWCGTCGQRHRKGRLDERALLLDVVDNLFSWDSAHWCTVRELTVDPAGVVRRYVDGQRCRYVNPVKYAIACVALYYLVSALCDVNSLDLFGATLPQGPTTTVFQEWNRLLIANERGIILLSLPLLAMVLGGSFPGRTFAENCVFACFTVGQMTLLGIAWIPAHLLAPRSAPWVFLVTIIASLAYHAWAARGFYGRVSWWLVRAITAYVGWWIVIQAIQVAMLIIAMVYSVMA